MLFAAGTRDHQIQIVFGLFLAFNAAVVYFSAKSLLSLSSSYAYMKVHHRMASYHFHIMLSDHFRKLFSFLFDEMLQPGWAPFNFLTLSFILSSYRKICKQRKKLVAIYIHNALKCCIMKLNK